MFIKSCLYRALQVPVGRLWNVPKGRTFYTFQGHGSNVLVEVHHLYIIDISHKDNIDIHMF